MVEIPKWEYVTLAMAGNNKYQVEPSTFAPRVNGLDLPMALNTFGGAGWELIHIDAKVYVFKRQKQGSSDDVAVY